MTTKQRLQYKDLRFVIFTFGEKEREKEGLFLGDIIFCIWQLAYLGSIHFGNLFFCLFYLYRHLRTFRYCLALCIHVACTISYLGQGVRRNWGRQVRSLAGV